MKKEIRDLPRSEIRAIETEDGKKKIGGLAAPYGELSEEMGFYYPYRERIMPGAFKRTLGENSDIVALVDHDTAKVLSRTSAGTMKVWESDRGLEFEAEIVETSYGLDLFALVKSNHVRGVSIGFNNVENGSNWKVLDGEDIREISDLDLLELSVVTFPAFPQTDVSTRSMQAVFAEREEVREKEEKERRNRGLPLDTAQTRLAVLKQSL
jgi:hypothetical protein